MASNTGLYILIIILLIVAAVVIYVLFLKPTPTPTVLPPVILAATAQPSFIGDSPSNAISNAFFNIVSADLACTTDQQCPWGQICSQNVCIPKVCSVDSNCPSGQHCVDKYCKPKPCETYRDCGKGDACVHVNPFDEFDRVGFCMPTANVCGTNSDCRAGTPFCVGGKCQQCMADGDCLAGEVCNSGLCRGWCNHDTDCGTNGSGEDLKHCIQGVHHCCPVNGTYGSPCELHSDCGPGSFCTDKKICTCVPTKGKSLGDKCSANRDCETGNCMTDSRGNKVCGYPGGKCMCDSQCPADKPFCVAGQCKTGPVGSTCSKTSKCRSTGQNLFCVDNICTHVAGELGAVCVDNDSCRSPLVCAQNGHGISICSEQKASNKLVNVNTNAGYIPPPGMPKRINRIR